MTQPGYPTSLFMRRPDLGESPQGASAGTVRVEPSAAASLVPLLDSAFEDEWDLARVRRELFNDPTVVATFVAYDGEMALATASARIMPDAYPCAGYVHWVGSAPEARGRGLARAVSEAVLEQFRESGLDQAVLETDDHRLPAIRLYLSLGFVPIYRDLGDESRWSKVFVRLAANPKAP